MGRLVGERLRRQVRAREEARWQGEGDEHHEGQPNFQAMADGKIDVILEDWQNLGSFPQYTKNRSSGEGRRRTGSPA